MRLDMVAFEEGGSELETEIGAESAETTPMVVKSVAMPSTNESESNAPRMRDFASVAPKMETVNCFPS